MAVGGAKHAAFLIDSLYQASRSPKPLHAVFAQFSSLSMHIVCYAQSICLTSYDIDNFFVA